MKGWVRLWSLCLLACLTLPAYAQKTVQYFHTDALGSVVAVTTANGAVIERREYEPYGAQLTPAVQDGPGYTGHVQDAATGLVYMQQRYYDPGIGRFLSVDPVTALSDPVGYFGRYHYANNNPYTFTDPDGRAWGLASKVVKVIIKGGDVGATVAGAVEDARVLFSRDATVGQRLMAAGSLATEVASPVSARDVKAGIAAVDSAKSKYKAGADFSQKTKRETAANADSKCEYCGIDTVQAKRSEHGVTPPRNEGVTDRVTPKSKGGDNSPGNAAHACRDCNEGFSNNPKPHPRDDLKR